MSKLVTIYGGSGFVGRYIARRMAAAGWRVRVAVRRPNEALFVRPYGAVGQVEPVLCNIRDEASVALAMEGADAVVNCVGVLNPTGRNSFEAVHVAGAGRVARIAAGKGIGRMVHISALGADPEADSAYARSKALGERAVLEHMPGAVILRPSVVFGTEDRFFNRFAEMARWSPFLFLFGADTRFQPVYVDDVAHAAELAVLGRAGSGIYELGGPEIATLRALVRAMLEVIHRRRVVVGLPFWIGRILAGTMDFVQFASFELVENRILTRDQLRMLRHDNVVSDPARTGVRTLADLGIRPTAFEVILPGYLWKFRPGGPKR